MQDIKNSLDRYVNNRIPPGGFLKSVLENNLMRAIGSADLTNRGRLHEICSYVYSNLPANVWGSKEIVKKHLEGK